MLLNESGNKYPIGISTNLFVYLFLKLKFLKGSGFPIICSSYNSLKTNLINLHDLVFRSFTDVINKKNLPKTTIEPQMMMQKCVKSAMGLRISIILSSYSHGVKIAINLRTVVAQTIPPPKMRNVVALKKG